MPTTENFTPAEVAVYFRARFPQIKQSGKEWRGPCPVHGGEHGSFSVNASLGLAFCHSECQQGKDGWNLISLEAAVSKISPAEARKRVFDVVGRMKRTETRPPSEVYPYTDENGQLLYQVVRKYPKAFFVQRPGPNGESIKNLDGVRRVPYNLVAVRSAELVLLPEGEKDVETLRKLGFVGTCNSGGAGKWTDELSAFLDGKRVGVLSDNDEVGRMHAAKVLDSLRKRNIVCAQIELPKLPEKGDVTDWVNSGGTKEELASLVEKAFQAATNSNSVPPPPLPDSDSAIFHLSSDGIFGYDRTERKYVLIGPPLEVLARTASIYGDGVGKLVRFRGDGGTERTITIRHTDLIGDGNDCIQQLVNLGYKPRRSRKCLDLLKEFLYQASPEKRVQVVQSVGFHSNCYVLPDVTIGPKEKEQIVFQSDTIAVHPYKVSGTDEDWKRQIGEYCAGNSRLVFGVSCAFAAPLLSLLGLDGGGFHFRGLSSTGKTTAIRTAGSVCGGSGGPDGFLRSWRATANGLEALGSLYNDGLLCLDEIGQNEKDAGEIVYALANGIPKNRMDKRLRSRVGEAYTLLILSSGERSLAEVVSGGGKSVKGGQEARLIDIDVDAGAGMGIFETLHTFESPDAMAMYLTRASREIYGAPLRRFLAFLCADLPARVHEAKSISEKFQTSQRPARAAGEVHRGLARFAAVAAAGELATAADVTGWKHGEASMAAARCFKAWLITRGGTGARDLKAGFAALRRFVQLHGQTRFQSFREPNVAVQNRAGWREDRPDGTVYYFYCI